MKKLCIINMFVLLITGCSTMFPYNSTSYRNYIDGTKIDSTSKGRCGDKNVNNLQWQICSARNYISFKKDQYKETHYKLKRDNTFLYDIPLIGLAVGTASLVAFSENQNSLAALAIGSGAVGGLKTYSNNKTKAKSFLKAEAAAICLYETTSPFENPESQIESINTLRNEINVDLLSSDNILNKPEFLNSTAEPNKTIKESLESKVTDAKSTNDEAIKTLQRIEKSPAKMISSIETIDLKLREKLDNEESNFDQILKSIADSTVVGSKQIEESKMESLQEIPSCIEDSGIPSDKVIEHAMICIIELENNTKLLNSLNETIEQALTNMNTCPDIL